MGTIAENVSNLRVCAWHTASLRAAEVASIDGRAGATHAGGVIVSSCQRTEAYQLGEGVAATGPEGSDVQPCGCGADVVFSGRDAVVHLAAVAAGLESVVLGEAQILGQVRGAFADAPAAVRQLGEVAIAAARQLRRETQFRSHAGHLLDRSLAITGTAARGRLLVLGAGAMGRLIAERGVELGFDEVVVAGRTRPNTTKESGWTFVPLAEAGRLAPFDVVAGCLGSGAGEVSFASLPAIGSLAIDLGTPRNFGTGVPCRLVTVAELLADEAQQQHRVRRRRELTSRLAEIVDARLARSAEDGASPVGALRSAVERVRQRELERAQRLHPEVAPETLDALTRALVNQIFHAPSKRLKESRDERLSGELAALFR